MIGADMNIGIKCEVLKMTKAFMNKELAYDLSISPFILLHENGVISDDELAKMGAQDGEMVRILDFYFEYHE